MKKYLKKVLLVLSLLFVGLLLNAQANFKWDVITESLSENKDQLYSKTKLFIGETWKSAQDVIQSDDKEAGIVLVKGLSIQNMFYQMNDHRWTYSYTIKFMMKDNKSRIIIDDVYCQSARCAQYEWPHMPVADEYPEEKGLKTTGVNEKRYNELMSALKAELQAIVDSYIDYVKQPITKSEDW